MDDLLSVAEQAADQFSEHYVWPAEDAMGDASMLYDHGIAGAVLKAVCARILAELEAISDGSDPFKGDDADDALRVIRPMFEGLVTA